MFDALFKKKSAAVRQEQLYEAERLQLEHAAAAEHHQALANMYAARIRRLQVPCADVAPLYNVGAGT